MSIVRKQEEIKLSKTVLDLKFMKKSKEKREIQEDAEERQQLYQGQLNMLHEGADKLIMLNSYYECTSFLPCRLSFGGFNPEIEKLNEDKLTGLYKVVKKEAFPDSRPITGMEADLDEEELAAGGFLGENIRKKFGIKRKSEVDDYGAEEESRETKKIMPGHSRQKNIPKVHERKLLTADIGNIKRENSGDHSGRGKSDFRGRGRGDFRGRGRSDFRGRGRGDFRGRGRGDFRGRGRGDFRGRGRGDFRGRGRGDFRGRGRGDFRGRGRGDFRGRGRGDFRGKGNDRSDFHGQGEGFYDRSNDEQGNGDLANSSYDMESSFDITFDKSIAD